MHLNFYIKYIHHCIYFHTHTARVYKYQIKCILRELKKWKNAHCQYIMQTQIKYVNCTYTQRAHWNRAHTHILYFIYPWPDSYLHVHDDNAHAYLLCIFLIHTIYFIYIYVVYVYLCVHNARAHQHVCCAARLVIVFNLYARLHLKYQCTAPHTRTHILKYTYSIMENFI